MIGIGTSVKTGAVRSTCSTNKVINDPQKRQEIVQQPHKLHNSEFITVVGDSNNFLKMRMLMILK